MGGLGNQMFQYAVGRALALARGTTLELDRGWYLEEGQRAKVRRVFELDSFELQARMTQYPAALVRRWEAGRLTLPRRRMVVIRAADADMAFDQSILDAPDRTLLIGYWQSEKYFSGVADVIRRDFSFRRPAAAENLRMGEAIRGRGAIAVHVRRADYVSDPMHPTLGVEYYERAARIVLGRVADPIFVVFSDDADWAKANLDFGCSTVYVTRNAGKSWEDLRLMTLCRHHIIANSSFSWWGAWLGTSPDKVVVAPERWFGDETLDTRDLIPPGWVRL